MARLHQVTSGVPFGSQMLRHLHRPLARRFYKSIVQQNRRVAAAQLAERLLRVAQPIRKTALRAARRWLFLHSSSGLIAAGYAPGLDTRGTWIGPAGDWLNHPVRRRTCLSRRSGTA